MTTYVALLYSVVLGAGRRIRSGDLLAIAERAGATGATVVLSTGNLIVQSAQSETDLEHSLEAAIAAMLGRAIPVFARSAADWAELVAANPFAAETRADPSRVAVRILRKGPDAATIARIAGAAGEGERFAVGDRALWLALSDRMARTPLCRAVAAPWAGPGTLRTASALAKISARMD